MNVKLLLGVILSWLLAMAAFAEGDGYQIKKRDFKKRVDVIALMPLVVPDELSLAPELATQIEADITRALKRKRFDILPSSEFRSVDAAFLEQKANAVLSPQIVYVAAEFDDDDEARWDGAEQDLQATENSLYDLMEKGFSGKVGATSIQIDVLDLDGTLLYARAGGIELVMKRNGKFFEALPVATLLRDEKRIRKAVKEALKGF